MQRYRDSRFYVYIRIQEEEEERSNRWKDFLERQAESGDNTSSEESSIGLLGVDGDEKDNEKPDGEIVEKEAKTTHKIQIWSQIRPFLAPIEWMMSSRIKNKNLANDAKDIGRSGAHLVSIEEAKQCQDSDDDFYYVKILHPNQEVVTSNDGIHVNSSEPFFPWKGELECLVRGDLLMVLREEVQLLLHMKFLPLL